MHITREYLNRNPDKNEQPSTLILGRIIAPYSLFCHVSVISHFPLLE